MAKKKILIVEDEEDILELVSFHFQQDGFDTMHARSGDEALDKVDASLPDLIILDLMLPEKSGTEVCKILKQQNATRNIPIIMLTAKAEEIDRIVGFELGADDYVTKPFSPRELILRAKAILKRLQTSEEEKEILHFGGLTIDRPKHQVMVHDVPVELTATEFKLLQTLVERKGRVQSREMLLETVWGYDYVGFTRTVDTHIKRLRTKLSKLGAAIETIRGVGYRFKEIEK
ncbi:MAG: response regulator [bacterium]